MSTQTTSRGPNRVLPPLEPASPRAAVAADGGGRRMFMIVGAVIALVGFGLTFALGTVLNRTQVSTVSVVVAARDLAARQPIVAADLKMATLPTAAAPAGRFQKVSDAVGLTTRVAVLAGQPVTSNLLTEDRNQIAPINASYLAIPAGYVAVQLPSSELQGVGGYIQPGDWIGVMVSVNQSLFNPALTRQVSKLVFTNLHVIAVGNVAQTGGGNVGSLTVVTTACDAEYLNWFLSNTQVKYVLESYKNYGTDPTAPDPSCPAITSGTGVGPAQVDGRYSFTKV